MQSLGAKENVIFNFATRDAKWTDIENALALRCDKFFDFRDDNKYATSTTRHKKRHFGYDCLEVEMRCRLRVKP